MIKHILYLVPGRLGDSIMISPALSLFKSLNPKYQIDILAFDVLGGSVYENNPSCRKIYILDEVQDLDQLVKHYDLIISAHRDSKVLDIIQKIKRPIIMIEPADQSQQQAQQALNFIQSVYSDGVATQIIPYQLFPGKQDFEVAAELLPHGQKLIGLHLGCHGLNKSKLLPWNKKKTHKKVWPLTKFIELATVLKQHHNNYGIVITGGKTEHHLAREFINHVPDTINLVGKTNVLQLTACIRRFSAYISSDTGAMHVACVTDTPLVALFGPTNSIRTAPYPSSNFRKPLLFDDLSKLNSDIVASVIKQLLDGD